MPVPSVTTFCSIPLTASAVAGDTTCCGAASGSSCLLPSASMVAATRRGGRAMPWLAMVVYTSSICIAVTAMP